MLAYNSHPIVLQGKTLHFYDSFYLRIYYSLHLRKIVRSAIAFRNTEVCLTLVKQCTFSSNMEKAVRFFKSFFSV